MSEFPRDLKEQFPPTVVASVERFSLLLGAWTANTTVTPGSRVLFDRAAIIREIWFSADAVPSDPDGTMLINALLRDDSEAGDDTLVSSFDAETTVVAANKPYKATLAAETAENERTVAAGDSLRFTLVNNSAAITTNPNVVAHVLVQFIAPVQP